MHQQLINPSQTCSPGSPGIAVHGFGTCRLRRQLTRYQQTNLVSDISWSGRSY